MILLDRRAFLRSMGAAAAAAWLPAQGASLPAPFRGRRLVLVELKGGNDGLNTVVPYADPAYYALRPRLPVASSRVLPLDAHTGLNPALRPLMPLWEAGELAIVQGVGNPDCRRSHDRAAQAWHTACAREEAGATGWLARAFDAAASDGARAHGIAIDTELGPLAGCGTGFAMPGVAFGDAVHAAACLAAQPCGPAVIEIALAGFDTHADQARTHAALLALLAEGLAALRRALVEAGRWQTTLVLTYSEFGRDPRENLHGGTDHGASGVQLVLGGGVRGGLHGLRPGLDGRDAAVPLACSIDFRSVYATVLERWWHIGAAEVLGGRHALLDLFRA